MFRQKARRAAPSCAAAHSSMSRSNLPASMNAIFERGQLFETDRTACVHTPRCYADFGAKAEFAAIGKLRRGIVQHNRRVDLFQESLRRLGIFGHNTIGVMRSEALDMLDRLIKAVHDAHRNDC